MPETQDAEFYLAKFDNDNPQWRMYFEEPEIVAWLAFAKSMLEAVCPDALIDRYLLLCDMREVAMSNDADDRDDRDKDVTT